MEPRGHWYRSYEEMSKDPKFRVIAKRASATVPGVRVSDAIAVWVNLLERASQSPERGSIEGFDCESCDALFDMPDGAACAIFNALQDKGMVHEGAIAKWGERQPQRERPTDLSTERTRRFKEKQRQGTPGNATGTPGNAPDQNRTEQREEYSLSPSSVVIPPREGQSLPPKSLEREFSDFSDPEEIPETDSLPLEFQQIKEAYPGPVDIVPAFKAYQAKRKSRAFGLRLVLDDLMRRSKSDDWTKDGGKWVPKLSRYLAEEMWRNDIRGRPAEKESPFVKRARELSARQEQREREMGLRP